MHRAWIEGGTDEFGYRASGCFDTDRGFYEWPDTAPLVDYVTGDPST